MVCTFGVRLCPLPSEEGGPRPSRGVQIFSSVRFSFLDTGLDWLNCKGRTERNTNKRIVSKYRQSIHRNLGTREHSGFRSLTVRNYIYPL